MLTTSLVQADNPEALEAFFSNLDAITDTERVAASDANPRGFGTAAEMNGATEPILNKPSSLSFPLVVRISVHRITGLTPFDDHLGTKQVRILVTDDVGETFLDSTLNQASHETVAVACDGRALQATPVFLTDQDACRLDVWSVAWSEQVVGAAAEADTPLGSCLLDVRDISTPGLRTMPLIPAGEHQGQNGGGLKAELSIDHVDIGGFGGEDPDPALILRGAFHENAHAHAHEQGTDVLSSAF